MYPAISRYQSDSDSDGFNDGDEVAKGTNPTDKGEYPEDGLRKGLIAYYPFNGNANDACTNDSISLSLNGGATTSSAGKMGNGLTLNGVNGRAIGSDDGSLDISNDWSIEAWIKPSEVSSGRTILAVADGDGSEENNELSIHFNSASQLQVCSGGETFCAATGNTFTADTWYHIAVTHDDSDNEVDIYVDNERVVTDNGFPEFTAAVSNADLIIGKGDESTADGFFAGVIDEVRVLNYQSMAFAGGLMISSVAGSFPGSVTVTVYNAADSNIDLAGVTVMQSSVSDTQCAVMSGTINSGSTDTVTCTVAADDMLYLADRDGDNNGANEGSSDTKFYAIDAVCWNDGSGTDSSCDSSSDAVIAAGLWAEDSYVTTNSETTLQLITNGNNDDGVSDWEAIPEFGTLLMPIASVLLIVGYNYRRKDNEN